MVRRIVLSLAPVESEDRRPGGLLGPREDGQRAQNGPGDDDAQRFTGSHRDHEHGDHDVDRDREETLGHGMRVGRHLGAGVGELGEGVHGGLADHDEVHSSENLARTTA